MSNKIAVALLFIAVLGSTFVSAQTMPDNVIHTDCVVAPDSSAFDMTELFACGNGAVNSMSTPMVADLDGDGVPEIVACKCSSSSSFPSPWYSKDLLVFNGQTGAIVDTIITPVYYTHGQCITIADIDNDGHAEIFLLEREGSYLQCYNSDGTQRWLNITNAIAWNSIITVADIMGDGTPELVCGGYIFNPDDGTLLLQGIMQETGRGIGMPHSYNTDVKPYYLYALADIDNDGKLELCAGNSIYSINITNDSGTTGNSWTLLRQATNSPSVANLDGQTFVSDFDGDGDLDICVIGTTNDIGHSSPATSHTICPYVWDGQTGDIIAHASLAVASSYGASIPYCGDLDHDGLPEIVFSVNGIGMMEYAYDSTQFGNMVLKHSHAAFGNMSGITSFDFNKDGQDEVVYRGTEKLLILDGSTWDTLATPISAYSGTLSEYPVVADVNGDGQAEIVIASAPAAWNGTNPQGSIRVFGSATPDAWSSARKVWNQWAYSSVNINEDLSVPQYRFDIATTFPNGKQPFNGFLHQMPYLALNGDPFVPIADAEVVVANSAISGDDFIIDLTISNQGKLPLDAPYRIAIYKDTYRGEVLHTHIINDTLLQSGIQTITITLPRSTVCALANTDSLVIAVNDTSAGIAQHGKQQPECDTTNNTVKVAVPHNTIDTIIVTLKDWYLPYIFLNDTITGSINDSNYHFTTVSGCDSLIVLTINVIEAPWPDNIDSAECTYIPDRHDWGIEVDWTSQTMVSPLVNPLVGDIDGDGIPEIVCFAPSSTYNFYGVTQVLVFNTITHEVIHSFNLPGTVSTVSATPYAMAKLPNGHVIFVVSLMNQSMYAYDLTSHDTSPMWSAQAMPNTLVDPTIAFADFNCDGWPEVYLGNRIYDATTGTLLISGLTTPNAGYSYTNALSVSDRKTAISFAADMVGDERLELLLGNSIYEVTLTNRDDTVGNSINLAAEITPPDGIGTDGHSQVADFNHDGHLDIFVSTKALPTADVGFYVWDVYNNNVSTPVIIPSRTRGKSVPLIADIDNDGNLEIVIQSSISSYAGRVRAYKYDATSNSFSQMWELSVDEDSWSNSMTMFDFNHDGMNDLLMSDQSTIKILNASGHSHVTGNDTTAVYTISSLSFGECTVMQYPVVADVDADGSAEIVACGLFGSGHTWQAYLNVFRSSEVPWAPARKVWNQYLYNVTNVNEDLSIPQYQFDNAVPFIDPDGILRRPYNNFLQQATTIDRYGRAFYAVPDIEIIGATLNNNGEVANINVNYSNTGSAGLFAPYGITVYKNSYRGEILWVDTVQNNLPTDSSICHTIIMPRSIICNLAIDDSLIVAVGDMGIGFAQNGNQQPECDTTNNTYVIHNIPHNTVGDTTAVACDSFTWWNTDYTNSTDTPTHTYTNAAGCDSVVTLHLTVNYSSTGDTTAVACDSFTWWNTDYTNSTDTPTHTYTNAAGCDSVVTLHLTVNYSKTNDTVIVVCDGLYWDAFGYLYVTQDAEMTVMTDQGCDSTLLLHLTVKHGSDGDTTAVVCDSLTWWNTTYTSSTNSPTHTFTNAVGCDSVVTLHLTVNYSSACDTTAVACDSLTWWNTTYTSSTNSPTHTLTNAVGCDSVVTLHLTVNYSSASDTTAVACDSFTWRDTNYTISTNSPTYTFTNAVGCDSVVTLHLTVNYSSTCDTTAVACDSFTWMDTNYTSGGDVIATYTTTNAAGCDSVVTLNLTVNYSNTGDTMVVACDSFFWWNTNYTNSTDTPTHTYTNVAGCDSVVTLHLTINHCVPPALMLTVCDTFTWHGVLYNTTGIYADGTDTLDLIVNYSSTGDTTAVACDSFTWWQTEVTESTEMLTHTYTNAAGCDSVVTLHLTINHMTTGDTFAVACDSFFWWNTNYTNSTNVPTYTYTSASGCDSVVTLHLTINYSNSGDTTVYACEGYNWHGMDYVESGDYVWPQNGDVSLNASGCDSVTTLHLTISHTSFGDTSASVCDSMVWHGIQLAADGEYQYLTTTAGPAHCDSIVTLHLTLMHSVVSDVADSFCAGTSYHFAGDDITVGGLYYDHLTSADGCDSTVRLTLSMLTPPMVSIDHGYDCLSGLHLLRANANVDYLSWSSSDGWPSEWGSNESRSLAINVNHTVEVTLLADYNDYPTCAGTVSETLYPIVMPQALMRVSPDFLTGDNLNLSALSQSRGAEWLQWYVDGSDYGGAESITYVADNDADSVIVSLIASTRYCSDSVEQTVYVRRTSIFAPNVFTPDEATNRTFSIFCDGVVEYELNIYSRQGLHVFKTVMNGAEWDGRKDGHRCPQGAYVWIVRYRTLVDPQNWHYEKGTVTLIR